MSSTVWWCHLHCQCCWAYQMESNGVDFSKNHWKSYEIMRFSDEMVTVHCCLVCGVCWIRVWWLFVLCWASGANVYSVDMGATSCVCQCISIVYWVFSAPAIVLINIPRNLDAIVVGSFVFCFVGASSLCWWVQFSFCRFAFIRFVFCVFLAY